MSGQYLAWVPERGETEEDGVYVSTALDHRDAAERYARRSWQSSDPFEYMTVRLRERNGTATWDVEIAVVPVPEFEAGRTTQVSP